MRSNTRLAASIRLDIIGLFPLGYLRLSTPGRTAIQECACKRIPVWLRTCVEAIGMMAQSSPNSGAVENQQYFLKDCFAVWLIPSTIIRVYDALNLLLDLVA